jgi:hypothetical protein
MARSLKDMDYDFVYTEYPNVGHDSWNNADADTDRLPWLVQYTRNPYPAKVTHRMFYLRYGKAYWLQITGKEDWNKFSEIHGECIGRNDISIQTNNISSFFVDLKHPALKSGEPVKFTIDRDSIIIDKYSDGMDFHFSKDSIWMIGAPPGKGLSKKERLEGPSTAIETGKFILVYGTGTADTNSRSKTIGTLLQKNYSNSDMEIKLIPDTLAINEKLETAYNLYVVGSPDENLYLREIVPWLPVSFTQDSLVLGISYSRKETGIQMIYPNPKQPDKYIIVDIYPEMYQDVRQLVDYPVADYFIYSIKGNRFEILKDEYFGSDWQVMK